MIETQRGFDDMGADCQQWMREAGLSTARVEPLVGPGFDGCRPKIDRIDHAKPIAISDAAMHARLPRWVISRYKKWGPIPLTYIGIVL